MNLQFIAPCRGPQVAMIRPSQALRRIWRPRQGWCPRIVGRCLSQSQPIATRRLLRILKRESRRRSERIRCQQPSRVKAPRSRMRRLLTGQLLRTRRSACLSSSLAKHNSSLQLAREICRVARTATLETSRASIFRSSIISKTS